MTEAQLLSTYGNLITEYKQLLENKELTESEYNDNTGYVRYNKH